jgi:uncharacterized membrane protein (UPF0127 family)
MMKEWSKNMVVSYRAFDGRRSGEFAVRVAASFREKLEGLLRTPREEAGCLVILGCRSVHTFGMKYPIDVALVGKGRVRRAMRAVEPGAVVYEDAASYVLERPASDEPWLLPGDRVELRMPPDEPKAQREAAGRTVSTGARQRSEVAA